MSSSVFYNNVPAMSCLQCPLSVATPDGGFLYIGWRCINYIAFLPADGTKAPEVKTMSTRILIAGLDVNPMWGKQYGNVSQCHSKQFAIVAEDFSIQVWDCVLGEAVSGHKAHQHQHEARDANSTSKVVLMSYMSNGNILSLDGNDLVNYCVGSNSYCRRPTFVPARNHQVTVLRCSPYNDNIFALGTAAGLVMVCDLRKMSIIYKLGGHKVNISGLAWREIAPKIDTKSELTNKAEQWRKNFASAKEALKNADNTQKDKKSLGPARSNDDDIFDIYNFDHLDGEFGAPASVRPRMSSKSSDDCADFVGVEKTVSGEGTQAIDYIEACESMKAELLARQSNAADGASYNKLEVTIADCKRVQALGPSSDSCCNSDHEDKSSILPSDSTEGSMEIIQHSYSSDDAVIVDGDTAKPKREVLHHIYHQAEVHATAQAAETSHPPSSTKSDLNTVNVDRLSVNSDSSTLLSEILLVSIDADDVIMIWNTQTGGHCGRKYSKTNVTNKFNVVHWLSDNILVANGKNQLCFWSLECDDKSKRYKIVKSNQHSCTINDITTFAVCPSNQQIWLCVRDRNVALFNPYTAQLSVQYGCLSFGLRAIAECPDDMNKIALGCANRRVAIFDLSKLSTRCIPLEHVYCNSAVYSLSWSPDSMHLAYGTFDGLVGIIDVERMKVVTTFRTVCKKEVYSLMWKDQYIYFIVNRLTYFYDVQDPKRDAVLISNVKQSSYLSVRGNFLFIGTDDGRLQLYERNADRKLFYTPQSQMRLITRYITDIVWNPLLSNQLAVVGHDKHIFIIEFMEKERELKLLFTYSVSDDKASITSLKWSNMNAHLLLTFHIEGKVCIWNTKELPEQKPLTITFHCPMWCGMFLPTDENIIVCSGKSASLEFVHIKKALQGKNKSICAKSDALLNVKWATKSPTQFCGVVLSVAEKKRLRNMERREHKKAAQNAANAAQSAHVEELKPELHMPTAAAVFEDAAVTVVPDKLSNPAVIATPVENLLASLTLEAGDGPDESKLSKDILAHNRTCLYLAQKELNKSPLEKLSIVLTEDAANIEQSVLLSKLFSTKVVAKELLTAELQNLKHSDNRDIAPIWLTMANFKLREELEHHIHNKTLNEWHLTLAPAVSYRFWSQCCSAYAHQLLDQGYVLHASTYLMALHMPEEAVQVLLKHEFYKESLLLARVYFPATDPIIGNIINKWLEQLEKIGNLAAAALICVLDNEMIRGFDYLSKFRNRTPEITKLMEKIKVSSQLQIMADDTKNEELSKTVELTSVPQ